jgi:hypothetical protein
MVDLGALLFLRFRYHSDESRVAPNRFWLTANGEVKLARARGGWQLPEACFFRDGCRTQKCTYVSIARRKTEHCVMPRTWPQG